MTNLKIERISDSKNLVDFVVDGNVYCAMKSKVKWALCELKRWQYTSGSNFTHQLFNLIAKADEENKLKLLKGFPAVMCAYLMWYYKESFDTKYFDDETFFEKTLERLDRI